MIRKMLRNGDVELESSISRCRENKIQRYVLETSTNSTYHRLVHARKHLFARLIAERVDRTVFGAHNAGALFRVGHAGEELLGGRAEIGGGDLERFAARRLSECVREVDARMQVDNSAWGRVYIECE
jgi:hypothetical protein